MLKAFADPDRAEEHRRQLDQKARSGVNPFRCGTRMTDWSSLDADRLHDWVLDLGLTPPPRKGKGTEAARWRPWWDANEAKMTDLQRDRMWEALDRVRFYQVAELKPDEPGSE